MRPLLAGLALLAMSAAPASAGPMFDTLLSPSLEAPPVASSASGNVSLEFSDALDAVDYTLVMNGITSPLLQAHIHLQAPGFNGPIALFLFELCPFAGCGPGDLQISGDIVLSGTATASSLVGGASFQDVLDAIGNGAAYVNVHTTQAPGGELRGNLVPEPGTLLLLAAGLAGVACARRQRAL